MARTASLFFGVEVPPERIIGETLVRSTTGDASDRSAIVEVIDEPDLLDRLDYDALAAHPIAAWVEDRFGLDGESDPPHLVRRRPSRIETEARVLASQTGRGETACGEALRRTLLRGSNVAHPRTGRPLFAFRLHQFLSKGDNVYSTIEPEGARTLVGTYQLRSPQDHGAALLPMTFCRECGQDYLVADLRPDADGTWVAARPGVGDDPSRMQRGYLYLSRGDDFPWPENPVVSKRLPADWFETVDGQDVVRKNYEQHLPRTVRVRKDGLIDDEGQLAWWVPSPFRFCLRCTTSYTNVRGNDYPRLATLDREGRASAITVIATSLLRTLRELPDEALDPRARKLLTFVDNRQDAALQSGHFNDFVLTAQLRGALVRALEHSADHTLDHEAVDSAVSEALALDFEEYALSPEAVYSARERAESALRRVVGYRVLADLKVGYRLTMPNLEQTGLLVVDYADLDLVAKDDAMWRGCDPMLADARPQQRAEW